MTERGKKNNKQQSFYLYQVYIYNYIYNTHLSMVRVIYHSNNVKVSMYLHGTAAAYSKLCPLKDKYVTYFTALRRKEGASHERA
jgi:hypothetical protein